MAVKKPKKPTREETTRLKTQFVRTLINEGKYSRGEIKRLFAKQFDVEPRAAEQFIAAEQLGRRCFGMELSPQFVDVIVTRWERLTGKKAILSPSAPEPAQPPRKPAATSR